MHDYPRYEERQDEAAEDMVSPVVTTINDGGDLEAGQSRKAAQRRLSEPLVDGERSDDLDKGPTGTGYGHWGRKERAKLDRDHRNPHEVHRG